MKKNSIKEILSAGEVNNENKAASGGALWRITRSNEWQCHKVLTYNNILSLLMADHSGREIRCGSGSGIRRNFDGVVEAAKWIKM